MSSTVSAPPNGNRFNLAAWSLADQGVVSLGNFLTQVILARSLPAREYGVFALVFGTMVLLNVCHWALIAYPLSIEGAAGGMRELRRLTSSSLALTVSLSVLLCTFLAGVAFFLHRRDLWLRASVALLCWQVQETLRRALMAHLRHARSLWGDCISYLGQAVVIGMLVALGLLTLPRVFIVIAVTSLIAAAVQAIQIRPVAVRLREILEIVPLNWKIGNWALLGHATDTATIQALPWTLALVYGPQQTAAFQAMANVIGISHPVMYGISNLIVPASAKANQKGGMREAWHCAAHYTAWGLCILLPYYAVLAIRPHMILLLFYGKNSDYLSAAHALPILLFAYVAGYLFGAVGAFFNGVKKPALVFTSELFAVAALILFAIPMTWKLGVSGSFWGFLAVWLARLTGGAVLLDRLLYAERANRLARPTVSISGAVSVPVRTFQKPESATEFLPRRPAD